MTQGGDEGKWWRREVVTKGSGEEVKWWWRGVVTKGSGEEGKWWRREVVTKGSGEEGKWWWRGVVTKGSGEEGKWWRREVLKKGNNDRFEVDWFFLCVLQRVVVPLCVVLCVSWSCGGKSHWNGCMIVVIWYCHVRRCMRIRCVVL